MKRMIMTKPLSRTEVAHLVYLHMTRDKMTYEQAKKTVHNLFEEVNTNHDQLKKNKYFRDLRNHHSRLQKIEIGEGGDNFSGFTSKKTPSFYPSPILPILKSKTKKKVKGRNRRK